MSDLVEFLKARLDEDEAIAKAMPFEGEWSVRLEGAWQKVMAGSLPVASGADVVLPHIARHDPARVRREVEAKRRVVELHGPAILRGGGGAKFYDATTVCRSCEPPQQFPENAYPCATIRLLALPYADHPDYREEWRP